MAGKKSRILKSVDATATVLLIILAGQMAHETSE